MGLYGSCFLKCTACPIRKITGKKITVLHHGPSQYSTVRSCPKWNVIQTGLRKAKMHDMVNIMGKYTQGERMSAVTFDAKGNLGDSGDSGLKGTWGGPCVKETGERGMDNGDGLN
jgi:hypothetical protein